VHKGYQWMWQYINWKTLLLANIRLDRKDNRGQTLGLILMQKKGFIVLTPGLVHAWTRHLELSSPPQRLHCTGSMGRRGCTGSDNRLEPDECWAVDVRASLSRERCGCWGPPNSTALSSRDATLIAGAWRAGRTVSRVRKLSSPALTLWQSKCLSREY